MPEGEYSSDMLLVSDAYRILAYIHKITELAIRSRKTCLNILMLSQQIQFLAYSPRVIKMSL